MNRPGEPDWESLFAARDVAEVFAEETDVEVRGGCRTWATRPPQVDGLMDGGRQRLRRGFRVIETMIWP